VRRDARATVSLYGALDSVPFDGITPAQNVRNNQAAVNGCEVGSLQEPSRHTCPCAAVPTPSHVNTNSHFLFSHDTVLIVSSKMLFRLGSARVDINLWNPLYAIAPFVLLLVSIPLVTFAIVTTFIAVVALSCRGLVVYINLGTALLIAWLTPPPSKSAVVHGQPLLQTPSPDKMPSQRHRNRRSSNISITSSQDTAVITSSLAPKSGSFTALSSNNDGARDYEGVGGWRDTGDDDEEALWMSINGRLELPAGPPLRRHQRSLTSGAIPISGRNRSPEAIRMSPVQSRARTPMKHTTDERHGNGDYFPLQPISSIRSMTNASDPSKGHQRRTSGSASSVSSTNSGIMMVVKEAGE
jgi:hypothetical protein